MLLKFAFVVAITATLVVASVTPTVTVEARDNSLSFNPPAEAIKTRSAGQARELPVPQFSTRQLTNAKRLAAGLALKPPMRRSQAARSVPSGTPTVTRGYLQMKNENGVPISFVRNTWNSFGEFGGTNDPAQYLIVEVDLAYAPLGSADIITINGPDAKFPFLGGIIGFSSTSDNISPGSFNYIYAGGTTHTLPGSPPQAGTNAFTVSTGIPEEIGSAIWTYDPSTQTISPQWVNTDSSTPVTFLGYTQDVILLTGDKTAFSDAFGPTEWITLTFIPI